MLRTTRNAAVIFHNSTTVTVTAQYVSGAGVQVIAARRAHGPPFTCRPSRGTFTGGSARGRAFSWPEVGIVTLAVNVADGDYLSAGNVPLVTASGNVGRFTAHHFAMGGAALTNRASAACSPASSFTYLGEPLGQRLRHRHQRPQRLHADGAQRHHVPQLPEEPGRL